LTPDDDRAAVLLNDLTHTHLLARALRRVQHVSAAAGPIKDALQVQLRDADARVAQIDQGEFVFLIDRYITVVRTALQCIVDDLQQHPLQSVLGPTTKDRLPDAPGREWVAGRQGTYRPPLVGSVLPGPHVFAQSERFAGLQPAQVDQFLRSRFHRHPGSGNPVGGLHVASAT
jgi:hypothetical protein